MEDDYEKQASKLDTLASLAAWDANTDLDNSEKEKADEEAKLKLSTFKKESWKNETSQYDVDCFSNGSTKRQLMFINAVGVAALEEKDVETVSYSISL